MFVCVLLTFLIHLLEVGTLKLLGIHPGVYE
jgi:hypothetical protein